MALYTQFQDPAQYYLQKEERRDEGLRNAMAMMMQMKMQQREWARQNRLDELSERRVSAYEKSVEEQNQEAQKQWQARYAAIDSLYPPGSRENIALKAGMSLDQLESNFYAEPTIERLTGWSGMSRDEWEKLSPTVKRQYFEKYFAEQNTETMAAYRQIRNRRNDDRQMADDALQALDEMEKLAVDKFKNKVMLGADNPLTEIQTNIQEARRNVRRFKQYVTWGLGVDDDERSALGLYTDPNVRSDPYWWIPEEKRDALKKKLDISQNNLAKPFGPMMSVTQKPPAPADELIAWGGGPRPITIPRAIEIAKSMNKDPNTIEVGEDGLIALGNQKFYLAK